MISTVLRQYESFLRISPDMPQSTIIRARAVYYISWAFIVSQFINLYFMTQTYGGWTADHTISVIACFAVLGTCTMLRWSKNFTLFAIFFSTLILGAVCATALPATGINSSLLPFLLLGSIANGFISGWRATVVYGVIAALFIGFLFVLTSTTPIVAELNTKAYQEQTFQRFVQAEIGIGLITVITSNFSYSMHSAFKALEKRIETAHQADVAKTNFLATISHELCTPMNGILGIGEVLAETPMSEEQKELMDILTQSSENMNTIVTDILDFSLVESDRMTVHNQAYNLPDILIQTLRRYNRAATGKSLSLQLHYDKTLPKRFITDSKAISRIVSVFLDNAIKFTAQGSVKVSVSGAQQTGEDALTTPHYDLKISVRDRGIGIPEDAQTRIFDKFEQVDKSKTREYGGAGLGLAIAQHLAGLLGGSLSVVSQEGEGSTFDLALTLEAAPAQSAPNLRPSHSRAA